LKEDGKMKTARISWLLITVFAFSTVVPFRMASAYAGPPRESQKSGPRVRRVSPDDFMTDDDAFFIRYLNPDPALSAVSDWPIVIHIVDLGGDIIDAGIIADRLNMALPVDEQPAFSHIKEMVDDCARTLGIRAPHLFVENSPEVNAYVTRLREPHLLVLTSSLYKLYKNRPKELKFIIGHELGHLKCNHLRCHLVGEALMGFAVGQRQPSGIKETLVAHLMVGQLFSWYRESEKSADRAGLICIDGDLQTAQCALLRLLHGTDEDIDPKTAAQEQIAFEKERFVRIIRKLRSLRTTHPFVMDRCLALEQWTTTRSYQELVQRVHGEAVVKRLVIDRIWIKNLPDSDVGFGKASDPIITAFFGGHEFSAGSFSNENNPSLEDLQWKAPFSPNMRIIIEVHDHDSTSPNDFIGACYIPVHFASEHEKRTVSLRRNIKERSTEVILPEVTVEYHVESGEK
jgi:Zn-dependent protease with chaperone function